MSRTKRPVDPLDGPQPWHHYGCTGAFYVRLPEPHPPLGPFQTGREAQDAQDAWWASPRPDVPNPRSPMLYKNVTQATTSAAALGPRPTVGVPGKEWLAESAPAPASMNVSQALTAIASLAELAEGLAMRVHQIELRITSGLNTAKAPDVAPVNLGNGLLADVDAIRDRLGAALVGAHETITRIEGAL